MRDKLKKKKKQANIIKSELISFYILSRIMMRRTKSIH